MNQEIQRKYLNITDIQQEYLPVSKKKIRSFVKKYLPVKLIGRRIFVERNALEKLLTNPDRDVLPLT